MRDIIESNRRYHECEARVVIIAQLCWPSLIADVKKQKITSSRDYQEYAARLLSTSVKHDCWFIAFHDFIDPVKYGKGRRCETGVIFLSKQIPKASSAKTAQWDNHIKERPKKKGKKTEKESSKWKHV